MVSVLAEVGNYANCGDASAMMTFHLCINVSTMSVNVLAMVVVFVRTVASFPLLVATTFPILCRG